MVTIRETVAEQDAERVCAILNQFDPEPMSPSSLIEKMQSVPEGWTVLRLTAFDGDEIVGFAHFRRNSGMNPGTFLLTIGVDEVRQGTGVGKALWEDVLGRAEGLGVKRIVPLVRESHRYAEQFFLERGFERRMSLRESYLDLSTLDPAEPVWPKGYRLIRWSETEDNEANREKFAKAFLAMDIDEPGTLLLGGFDRASIERDAFDKETADLDCLYLVEHEGEWVAHHQVTMNEPGSWDTASITFTGTVPEHRRRGLASRLKDLGVRDAKSRGAKRILTHNDSSNEGMLTINRRQGFEEEPGWLLMVKDL